MLASPLLNMPEEIKSRKTRGPKPSQPSQTQNVYCAASGIGDRGIGCRLENMCLARQPGLLGEWSVKAESRRTRRFRARSPGQVARFFDGLELVDPGVVPVPRWRPDPSPFSPSTEVYSFCGVGRKR